MPKAKLPHNLKGWVVAMAASFNGLMAGFLTIRVMEKIWK